METLAKYLSSQQVKLDDVLLDPNNPRFAELGDSNIEIPESRFAETKIQKDTFEKRKTDRFDVSE